MAYLKYLQLSLKSLIVIKNLNKQIYLLLSKSLQAIHLGQDKKSD